MWVSVTVCPTSNILPSVSHRRRRVDGNIVVRRCRRFQQRRRNPRHRSCRREDHHHCAVAASVTFVICDIYVDIIVGITNDASVNLDVNLTSNVVINIITVIIFPVVLYALGCDAAAGLLASVLLMLEIASQIPKKLIFCARPWVVSRALPIRRDERSSPPSRSCMWPVVFT